MELHYRLSESRRNKYFSQKNVKGAPNSASSYMRSRSEIGNEENDAYLGTAWVVCAPVPSRAPDCFDALRRWLSHCSIRGRRLQ
jgi:hypothetical protein